MKTLRGHGNQRVSALGWSASGASLLSAADYDICHWDVLTGELRTRKRFESKVSVRKKWRERESGIGCAFDSIQFKRRRKTHTQEREGECTSSHVMVIAHKHMSK